MRPGMGGGPGMGQMPEPRGMPGGYAPSEAAMTDTEEAYATARAGAAASRQRNQGSTNILTWA
jgi:hypothetical protein